MTEDISKEKENAIIDAASKRFAHFGFSKVTMEEIAADVDMGKASLYYYFPAKENLFQAVLAREQDAFIAEMEIVLNSSLPASKKLIECVKKRLIYFQNFINLGTLGLHSYMDNKAIYKKFFHSFEQKELELINRILSEGKAKGEFRTDIYTDMDKVLLHTLHGLRLRAIRMMKELSTDAPTIEELQKEMILVAEIFLRGISK